MSKTYKAFAFFFLVLFVASLATPLSFKENLISNAYKNPSFETAATDYNVEVRVYNRFQAFNDDDFEFRVLNGSLPLDTARVGLYNATTGVSLYNATTNGNGYAEFNNLPQGVYQWNVSHDLDPVTPQATGQIVSDGPEANVHILFGNIDWDNDDDDLNATITDIEGEPAQNLNFSIHYLGNNSIWAQAEVIDGKVGFVDLPIDNYTWRVTVLDDPTYKGYLLDEGTVESNGTQLLVHYSIGRLTGNPDYLDLEIFTYYETSLAPIVGVDIEVTFQNGSSYASKVTPANGTVIFVDLPAEFINWTVTYMGQPIGLGDYFYNLTAIEYDFKAPIVTGHGDLAVLVGTENVTLTWTLEDEHPYSIEVWIGDTLDLTTPWTNTTFDYIYNVSASTSSSEIGEYEIKLVAYDLNSNSAFNITRFRIYENVTPVIEGPDPVEFTFSEIGYSLSWNVTDEHPDKYELRMNDENLINGTINPDEPVIEYSLDGLEIGVHNFTLTVNDTSGNTAMNSVLVTVHADDVPPVITYTPADIYYSQGDTHQVYNWTASDDFMDYYEILADGVVVLTEDWTTNLIEFDFSGFAEGEHSVTLRVYDLGGNMAESTVMVYVSVSTAYIYLIGTTIVAAVAIVFIGIVWFVRYR